MASVTARWTPAPALTTNLPKLRYNLGFSLAEYSTGPVLVQLPLSTISRSWDLPLRAVVHQADRRKVATNDPWRYRFVRWLTYKRHHSPRCAARQQGVRESSIRFLSGESRFYFLPISVTSCIADSSTMVSKVSRIHRSTVPMNALAAMRL
jgi:hypothetical protein